MGSMVFRQELTALLPVRRALRLQADEDTAHRDGSDDPEEVVELVDLDWEPGEFFNTPEEALERTESMLERMLNERSARAALCDLALVRSPTDFTPQNPAFPGIRPGLYVGDYGHDAYGQYRTEVLLVEYSELTPAELREEASQPSRLFARPGGEKAPPVIGKLADLACP